MSSPDERVLTVEQAAKIIYGAESPDIKQVGKVREKIHNGQLRRSPKGGWTTTVEAVADYMAHRAVRKREPAAGGATATAVKAKIHKDLPSRNVTGTYEDLLRDYFMAVVLRRTARRRTRSFDRAVIVGQVGFVLLAAWLAFAAVRNSLPTLSPERAAVLQWLAENEPHGHEVEQWFEPVAGEQAGSITLRVRYKYLTRSRKSILTDRQFVILDGVVRSVRQTE